MRTNPDQKHIVYYGDVRLSSGAILHSLEDLDRSHHVTTWTNERLVPEDRRWPRFLKKHVLDQSMTRLAKGYVSLYRPSHSHERPFLVVQTVPGHPALTRWSGPLALKEVLTILRVSGEYGEVCIAKLLAIPSIP